MCKCGQHSSVVCMVWLDNTKVKCCLEQCKQGLLVASSAYYKILCIVWNQKMYSSVHMSPPLFPVMSQMNEAFTSHLIPEVLCNVILPWVLREVFSSKSCVYMSAAPCVPYALPVLSSVVFVEEYNSCNSSL